MSKMAREYVRSTLFGVEDSLVSTTGLIVGVSAGSGDRAIILLAGIVGVAIEALSMAAGEFLSAEAMHEMDKGRKRRDNSIVSGFLMFFSYLAAGMIPILPVVFFTYPESIYVSLLCSLIGLFILGYVKGKVVRVSPWKSGLKVLIIGGVTAIIGVVVGRAFKV